MDCSAPAEAEDPSRSPSMSLINFHGGGGGQPPSPGRSPRTFANDGGAQHPRLLPSGLEGLPVEIHAQILRLVDPLDVLSYSRTCKRFLKYADDQHLWKHQWEKLSSSTPFVFLAVDALQQLGVNFKDLCRRLWNVVVLEGAEFGGLAPSKCIHCREYTCLDGCIEETRSSNRVALDIGGKITWVVTSNFTLKRHLSMLAVPKTLKCYDCDTTISRNEYVCDCVPQPPDFNPSLGGAGGRDPYCHSRLMSCHTALEYCSQPLSDIWEQPTISQPFCLFCDDDKVHRMLCEREMVTRSSKNKMRGVVRQQQLVSAPCASVSSPLTNGYCNDTASILGANNLDLVSPLLAMNHEEAFPVVRAFLTHLLKQNRMVDDLRKPNSSLTMTEPGNLPLAVKESLLKFFFEEVKISRLCLLPKPLAVAKLFDVRTCIVVDSGATSTSVWIVVDGKVDETRTQSTSVGGWNVSQFLKQALTWASSSASSSDDQAATAAVVSSLDTSAVKQKCRLSLNLSTESTNNLNRTETLHIKSQKDRLRKLELTEVTLSSELYLAPEMMYASLNLPGMVHEAAKDLPQHLVKDCFSHILITGGNTDLQGFAQRFSRDLRELMPEHSPIIDVHPHPTGTRSWNSVMGSHAVQVPPPYESILQLYEPGCPLWMTREEYITFGGLQLAARNTGIREG